LAAAYCPYEVESDGSGYEIGEELMHSLPLAQGGASILSAALEAAAAAAAQDGHVIPAAAPNGALQRQDTPQQPAPGAAAAGDVKAADGAGLLRPAAAGTAQLVARATRLGPKPAADSLPGVRLKSTLGICHPRSSCKLAQSGLHDKAHVQVQ
jgi:hypothetical protein